MTTKRQIVDRAYSAAGLASYAFDLSAEELNQARQSLDGMVASWGIKGQRIGYNAAPDLDAVIDVPDWAEEALALNLALRLSGAIGKQVMPQTQVAAREAYSAILSATTRPIARMSREVPAGAGNRYHGITGITFIPQSTPPLLAGDDSELEF